MTEIDADQMILPKELADEVRAGALGDTHIHVHTQASSSDAIAQAVRQAARDFTEAQTAYRDVPATPRVPAPIKSWPPKLVTQHFRERDGKVYLVREEIVYEE